MGEGRYSSAMEEDSSASLLKQQLPLIVGMLTTIFIALRILSAAAYNPTTAYGILQAEGTGTVIVGSLLSVIGIFPVWLFAISIFAYDGLTKKRQDSVRAYFIGTLVALFLAGIFITPILGLIFMAGVGVFEVWIRGEWRRNARKDREARGKLAEELQFEHDRRVGNLVRTIRKRKSSVPATVVIFAVLLIFQSVSALPWLPTEKVDVKGTGPLVGWVLSSPGTFTSVLLTTGQIKYLATNAITGRQICIDFGQAPINTTIPELTTRSVYPACPFPAKQKMTRVNRPGRDDRGH
jgi:hypothetical protein